MSIQRTMGSDGGDGFIMGECFDRGNIPNSSIPANVGSGSSKPDAPAGAAPVNDGHNQEIKENG